MGADMRAVIEVNHGDDDWLLSVIVHLERDYQLYARLTGIRDESGDGPLYPLRGVPLDASEEARQFLTEDTDFFHKPSWLTLAEARTIEASLDPRSADWSATVAWMTVRAQGDKTRVRVIVASDQD